MPSLPAPHSCATFARAAVLLTLFPALVSGCALPASTRARVLPQVFVTVRRAWTPRDLAVQGTVSFPLRQVTVASAATGPEWFDDELAAGDAAGPSQFDGGLRSEPREVACRRSDTCAWQRTRTARVLAAWGVAP